MSDDLDAGESVVPGEPPFPKTVLIAGITWIVLGGQMVLFAGLILVVQGPMPSPVFWGLVFGAASVYVGIYTVRGRARDVLGNAIGSIVFGLFVLVHAFSVVTSLRPQQGADNLIDGVLHAGGATFVATAFLAPGVLALLGRENYRAWLRDRKSCSTSHDT